MRAALTPEEARALDEATRTLGDAVDHVALPAIDVDAIMTAAFRGALGREPDPDGADRALWREAFRRARAAGFADP